MKVLALPDECSDLSVIGPENGSCFQAAMGQSTIKSHHYYFPRLLFGGQREDRLLLFEKFESSILLYSLKKGKSRLALNLYVPPFPFEAMALQRAMARMRAFNQGRAGRIDWVQEREVPIIASNGFSLTLREREFIYDRAAVAGLKGSEFARLRQNLASLRRYKGLEVREFTLADEAECRALYRIFCDQLRSKGVDPKGYSTMVRCLKETTKLPRQQIRGQVFEIDGTIRAYSFGGLISSNYGCVFLTVSDHGFPGLAYGLRHQMMMNFPDIGYFNDSTDNGRVGLREMKQRLRPIEMHGIWRAREDR